MPTFEKNLSVHKYSKLCLAITPGTPNVEGNYTPISYRLYIQAFSGGYPWANGNYPYNVKFDGVTIASGSGNYKVPTNGQYTLLQGTRNVYHSENGTKTLNVSGYFSGASAHGSATASGSIVLSTIPRYAVITSYSISSITRNSFKFNYVVDRSIDAVQYRLNGGSWQSQPSGNVVTGLSANATYTVRIRVRNSASGLWTESGDWSVVLTKTAASNTPTLSSRTCIQLVMDWTSNLTCTEAQYRIGEGSWISAGTFTARTSGSFTITGRAPGTNYSISVRVKDEIHGTWSSTSSGRSVTTVKLSTYTLPSFNTGSSVTVSIARDSTSLYHDVTLQFWHDDQSWHDLETLSNRTTSAVFTLTEAQLNKIYNGRVNSKTTSIRVKVVNKWGSGGVAQDTNYSTNSTVTIVNANPSIISVAYKDVNSVVQATLGDSQKILRNKSTLRVIAGQATSQKGATLSSYKLAIGGNEYNVSAAGTSETGKIINIGAVNQSGNQTAVLTVIDSRGYTASLTFTVQMLDYEAPQFLQADADRLNNYEESTTLNIEARRAVVKPGSIDVNEIYLRYRIKENPSGAYGDYVALDRTNKNISGIYQSVGVSQYMNDYQSDKSYTIEIGISDRFTTWRIILITLTEGIALLSFFKDRIEVGVPIIDRETGRPYMLGE